MAPVPVARVVLTLPSGAQLELASGEFVVLGREHAVGDERAFVGRRQARLLLYEGAAVLESLCALNATFVFRADPKARAIKLRTGQTCVLEHGDSVGLVGKAQLVVVRLIPVELETLAAASGASVPETAEAVARVANLSETVAADRGASLGGGPEEGCERVHSAELSPPSPPAKRAKARASGGEGVPDAPAGGSPPESRNGAQPATPPADPPAEAGALELVPLSSFAPLPMAWRVHAGELLVGTAQGGARACADLALFDLDGTLLRLRAGVGFARGAADYTLPAPVLPTMARLAADGYALCVLCNHAGIKGAFGGALASQAKDKLERLARALSPAPLVALIATRKPSAYRRPRAGMFAHLAGAVLPHAGEGPRRVLCVGTAPTQPLADGSDDSRAFAAGLGEGVAFQSAEELFGFETAGGKGWAEWAPHRTHAAPSAAGAAGDLRLLGGLAGGHLAGPLLLLLCGPPGAGKSHLCAALLAARARLADPELGGWRVACQDTASADGTRPGPRAAVERAASEGLEAGESVAVDRTHLTRAQRAHFVGIARRAGARVLACQLLTPLAQCEARIRARAGHPAGVEGEAGAAVLRKLSAELEDIECEAEGIDALLCCAPEHAHAVALLLASGVLRADARRPSARAERNGRAPLVPAAGVTEGAAAVALPPFGWGTYEVGPARVPDALAAARAASAARVLLDCAPSYRNEVAVGQALRDWADARAPEPFVCTKLAKGVVEAAQVGPALRSSLGAMGVERCGLLLLHWPCEVIERGTLAPVWAAMRALLDGPDSMCEAIGVCNFTPAALELLPTPPAAVQVERHPLLPQWELLLYCGLRGIALIAHMPLGGSSGAAELTAHPAVVCVARECGRTPAQVLLRWNLQHGCAVVTRASAAHGLENGDLAFTLGAEHMRLLDGASALAGTTRYLSVERVPFMRAPGAAYSW